MTDNMTWSHFKEFAACWGPVDDPDVLVVVNGDPIDMNYGFNEYYTPNGGRRVHRAVSVSRRVYLQEVPDIPDGWIPGYELLWSDNVRDELKPVHPDNFDPPRRPRETNWTREYHLPRLQKIDSNVLTPSTRVDSVLGIAARVGAELFIRFRVYGPWRKTHEPLHGDWMENAASEAGTS